MEKITGFYHVRNIYRFKKPVYNPEGVKIPFEIFISMTIKELIEILRSGEWTC